MYIKDKLGIIKGGVPPPERGAKIGGFNFKNYFNKIRIELFLRFKRKLQLWKV